MNMMTSIWMRDGIRYYLFNVGNYQYEFDRHDGPGGLHTVKKWYDNSIEDVMAYLRSRGYTMKLPLGSLSLDLDDNSEYKAGW